MRRIALLLAIVAGAAAVLGGGVYWMRNAPLTVAVLQPETDLPIKVFGLGTVEARVLSKTGFKVAGTLTDLRADHGDLVPAGRLLATIDASEQQARVAKARAQVAIAEAAIQVAEAAARKSEALHRQRVQTNRRRQSLLERQSVSQEAAEESQANEAIAGADLLVVQSEILSARAKLDDARAQLDSDTAVLGQHELKAPFDALVVSRAKELGAVVSAGEALFTLAAPETVWILAYVDEARAGDIAVGQPAEVKLRSLPQNAYRGTVARVGIESDRVNEERRVYVTCTDCPKDFHLGEQAEVFVTKARLPRALMIPEKIIERFDGATGLIWIVRDGRLARLPVRFGYRNSDGRVELRSGLPDGALVPTVVDPGFREGRAVSMEGPRG
ncbi:MAG: efflux RND transporter periplasmic adaptor subunit [Rhodoplanes sp.]|uniref:efflux RND transporter periplasmic adaptor subunit n=1 Tax=Rhodoplanes sp. TaxID=1968906 RepID=UPI001802DA82|nr:efflux RND transporter periplasmic adaptor subunit [Rhodoplanes sp.]NVO16330.1 efflux RND transporter periplasmic adaptor subunit [Rhodoplanes sp.]